MSARRIAYTTAIQILGKFAGFFISSFYLVILAGTLGTSGMGYYTAITAFLTFFMTIADLGVSTVMIREIAQNPERKVEISGDFLGLRIVFGFAVMAVAPIVAALIPQYRGVIASGVVVAAIGQFLLLVNQAYVSILQANTRLDLAVLAELVNRLVTVVLAVWGVHLYTHDPEHFLTYALWVVAAGSLANLVVCAFFSERFWKTRPRFTVSRWREMAVIVLPMGLFSFLGIVHFRSDTIILSLLKGSHDVGVYGYAYKIGEILLSIPAMFIGVIFPTLSILYKDSREEFRFFAQKVFTALSCLTFALIVEIFALAPYLTILLSRQSLEDGVQAGKVLRILCLAMFCWYFGSFYQNMLLVGSQYRGLIRNMAIAAGCNIVLNLIFIPRFSYFAAGTITVVTELIMLVLTVVYVRKATGFTASLEGFAPIIAASVAMCAAVVLIQRTFGSNLTSFAAATRIDQLLLLLPMAAAGAAVFVGVMLLWGKRSPLYLFAGMLRRG